MADSANPCQQYQQNAVKSAGRGELTLMLYNGAIKFIKLGMKLAGEENIQGAHNAIVRAQEIITHLNDTLNMDYELSAGLASLYDYINRRLVEGNMKKDQDILGEALGLVEDLRNTWAGALKLSKPNMASGQ
ncbi:Flagellar protein FliS [Pelotomaculum schinkii]|uniref:Flagellar secretion chaperone FliS n=1 Tax=Pelotomaculum schinkii TaxID=78350 RepID=A0A4Y7R8F9_9FIRM|nr:flagellar export chaperone FliS [Pelotomaculum schinkii]TEB04920.1 Flagellar protein FliS [Pelotomaculum schinkii]